MSIKRPLLAIVTALLVSLPAIAAPDQEANPPATQPAGPLDFRKLKEFLPAELAGIRRTEATGEKQSFGEWKISTARGSYVQDENQDDAPRIEVEIIDYSGTKGIVEAMTVWAKMEIDRESDSGYEKTTKIGEHPAFETWQSEGKSGQLQIFVGNRYLLQITTTNLPAEKIRKVGEELKLDDLAAMN